MLDSDDQLICSLCRGKPVDTVLNLEFLNALKLVITPPAQAKIGFRV